MRVIREFFQPLIDESKLVYVVRKGNKLEYGGFDVRLGATLSASGFTTKTRPTPERGEFLVEE